MGQYSLVVQISLTGSQIQRTIAHPPEETQISCLRYSFCCKLSRFASTESNTSACCAGAGTGDAEANGECNTGRGLECSDMP